MRATDEETRNLKPSFAGVHTGFVPSRAPWWELLVGTSPFHRVILYLISDGYWRGIGANASIIWRQTFTFQLSILYSTRDSAICPLRSASRKDSLSSYSIWLILVFLILCILMTTCALLEDKKTECSLWFEMICHLFGHAWRADIYDVVRRLISVLSNRQPSKGFP